MWFSETNFNWIRPRLAEQRCSFCLVIGYNDNIQPKVMYILRWTQHIRTHGRSIQTAVVVVVMAAVAAAETTKTAISAFSIRVKYILLLLLLLYAKNMQATITITTKNQIIWCVLVIYKTYFYKMRIKWPIESAIAINICEQLNFQAIGHCLLNSFNALVALCCWIISIHNVYEQHQQQR